MVLTNDPRRDHYFDLVVAGLISLGVMEVLGPAAMLPILADVIDPYDYNQALNRDALNKFFGQLSTAVTQQFDKIRPSIISRLKAAMPGLTEDQYQDMARKVLTPYQLVIKQPNEDNLKACYPDSDRKDSPVMGGPPTTECDQVYRSAYYEYVNAHTKEYYEQKVTNTAVIDKLLNAFERIDETKQVNQERNDYLLTIYSAVGVLAFAMVILFLIWFFTRARP